MNQRNVEGYRQKQLQSTQYRHWILGTDDDKSISSE